MDGAMQLPETIVVMGVSGAGKTEVGRALASLTGGLFEDADDYHSEAAREQMRAGIPLTDEDRWPWLERLRARILAARASGEPAPLVLACSALRAAYREMLRGDDPASRLRFVLLDGSRELIGDRIRARRGHYMPPSLLDSQLAILERSGDLLAVSIEPSPPEIAREIRRRLGEEAAA